MDKDIFSFTSYRHYDLTGCFPLNKVKQTQENDTVEVQE